MFVNRHNCSPKQLLPLVIRSHGLFSNTNDACPPSTLSGLGMQHAFLKLNMVPLITCARQITGHQQNYRIWNTIGHNSGPFIQFRPMATDESATTLHTLGTLDIEKLENSRYIKVLISSIRTPSTDLSTLSWTALRLE